MNNIKNKIKDNDNDGSHLENFKCEEISNDVMKTGIGIAGFGIGIYFLFPFIIFMSIMFFIIFDGIIKEVELIFTQSYEYIDKKIDPKKYESIEMINSARGILIGTNLNSADNMGSRIHDNEYKKLFKEGYITNLEEFTKLYQPKIINLNTLQLTSHNQDICKYFDSSKYKGYLECKNEKLFIKFD